MANAAWSDLTELTSLAAADLLCVTDDSESVTEKSKYIQMSTLRDYLLITGYYQRPAFAWKDADEIYIGAGFYDVAGKYAAWTSQLTKSFSGLSASTRYWIYLDYSAITSGTAITATEVIYNTTTPAWSGTYRGWYNGSDRLIFSILTDGSGNILEFFHAGDYVAYADQITDRSPATVNTTWADVTLSVPGALKPKAMATFWCRYGAYDVNNYITWRTNGQSGTTGHRVGASILYSQYEWMSMNSAIVIPDSSGIIEIKSSTGTTNNVGVYTGGWFFPVGM